MSMPAYFVAMAFLRQMGDQTILVIGAVTWVLLLVTSLAQRAAANKGFW